MVWRLSSWCEFGGRLLGIGVQPVELCEEDARDSHHQYGQHRCDDHKCFEKEVVARQLGGELGSPQLEPGWSEEFCGR